MNSLAAAWVGVKALFGFYDPEPAVKDSPQYMEWKINNQELAAAKEKHNFVLNLVSKLMWIVGIAVAIWLLKKFKIF